MQAQRQAAVDGRLRDLRGMWRACRVESRGIMGQREVIRFAIFQAVVLALFIFLIFGQPESLEGLWFKIIGG